MTKRILTLLAVLTLAACSQSPQPEATPAATPTPAQAMPTATELNETLPKYHWQLTAATDANGQRLATLFARGDHPLQLDFDARGLSISNTCNRMHGGYQLDAGTLSVGPLASTLMACSDPALSALDQAVGTYLNGAFEVRLDTTGMAPQLALQTAAGDVLTFTGVATAESRFGGPGAIVFLEIAPQTKPCSHPLMAATQCLEARELHYDAKGLKSGEPGPWQVLAAPIEGYTHEAGVRNVLRVKRFEVANPPADAASVAYVLDMVVETELPSH